MVLTDDGEVIKAGGWSHVTGGVLTYVDDMYYVGEYSVHTFNQFHLNGVKVVIFHQQSKHGSIPSIQRRKLRREKCRTKAQKCIR